MTSHRLKFLHDQQIWVNSWFWRTIEQKEIDYLEESNGQFAAYEFKWNPDAKIKSPKKFSTSYPDSPFKIIHRDNFEDFVWNDSIQ